MPAYRLRLDDVTRAPDGGIELKLTSGWGTLPATWSGTGLRYASLEDAVEEWRESREELDRQLADVLLLLLFRYAKKRFPDATGAQFRNAVRGRVITLDLDAAALGGLVTLT